MPCTLRYARRSEGLCGHCIQMKNFALVLASLIVAFALSVGADRLAGLFQGETSQQTGLIFPPNTEYFFRTPEFSYAVRTNSLGFRDREFGATKRAAIRIVALGDSFTFGWGVDAEQAWPKVLESQLRASGDDLEIANLGQPGASPANYAAVAEKAVPLLKPDLVIVAVLQGDDLAQLAPPPRPQAVTRDPEREDAVDIYLHIQQLTVALYPHLVGIIGRLRGTELSDQWRHDAAALLRSMTPDARARFEKLDPEIKDAFVRGRLNPALIGLAVRRPDYFLSVMDADAPTSQPLIRQMGDFLSKIDSVARAYGCDVLVVSVPYGVYVSQSSYETRRRLGFDLVPEMLTTDAGDAPIRRASEVAHVPFRSVTAGFREASLHHDLFFPLDGHLNIEGHERFASLLAPLIKTFIRTKSARK